MLSWPLILAPAVFAFLYVRAFGVSVVFSDAWSMVPLFEKYLSGTLSLPDLLAQHNEHRMVFPEAFEVLLGTITRYNNVVEMYVIEVCFLLTLVVLLLAFRRGADGEGKPWLFLFLPVSLLVFSFRQYENMLFGYQINFSFTQTFGVLTLFLLYVLGRTRRKKLTFAAALASATVASFSTVQGLFVWPAGLLQLLMGRTEGSMRKVCVLIWTAIGAAEWISYFTDYHRPKNSPPLTSAFEHPVTALRYFLNLLGSSLFWSESHAFAGGIALSVLALLSLVLVLWLGRVRQYSFWVSLLFYSLLMLAAIALGRSGVFGVWQALAPRYTTFSVLAAVCVYAMLLKGAFERRSLTGAALAAILAVAVLVSGVFSYSIGIKVGEQQKTFREEAAFVLYTYRSEPAVALAKYLHPKARIVRERAPVLKRLRYNVFSRDQTPETPPPLSGLRRDPSTTPAQATVTAEGIRQENSFVIVPRGAHYLAVSGWAVDEDAKSSAGGVYLNLNGKPYPAFYGLERPDVERRLGLSSYGRSGFERYLPASKLKPGLNRLSVVVLKHGRKGYYRSDLQFLLKR